MDKNIVVNGKDVVITKLPLKKYADLLASFEELPKHLDLISGKSQNEIIVNLPKLLATCYPDIVRILTIATILSPEEIDAIGLDDFIRILSAILEVNNYSEIYDSIKKMIAHPKAAQNTQEIGSGGQ